MLIHVVTKGESLFKIAARYRVTIESIIAVNTIPNPDQLLVGHALVIPTEGLYYTVKPGDSPWKIAQNYGVPLQDLLKINNITDPKALMPGTRLYIPMKPRPQIDVNGFIYILGEKARPIVKEEGRHLTYLSPFAYRIRQDGSLEPIDDTAAIAAGYEERAVPMMAITNFTATEQGENLAHVVLNNTDIVDRLLTNIISIMKQKGYQALNVDFEGVLPQDRESYNQFLQRAVDRLHTEGFIVSSSLAPKTGPTQMGLLYEAHDYPAHGRILDFVVLMTYEWGYRKGPPQPISPLNEIKKVLDYAVTVIPRQKIFFGFQIYARDWLLPHVQGQEAETFSNREAILRAYKYGSNIQYNTVAQSPFYRYRDDAGRLHEVWFEDARSAQAKFDTVKAYNLGGISYWALGFPFPENWILLEDNFRIRKLL